MEGAGDRQLALATETIKTDEGTVPRLAIQIILILLFVCLFFFLGFRFTGCSKQHNIENKRTKGLRELDTHTDRKTDRQEDEIFRLQLSVR